MLYAISDILWSLTFLLTISSNVIFNLTFLGNLKDDIDKSSLNPMQYHLSLFWGIHSQNI